MLPHSGTGQAQVLWQAAPGSVRSSCLWPREWPTAQVLDLDRRSCLLVGCSRDSLVALRGANLSCLIGCSRGSLVALRCANLASDSCSVRQKSLQYVMAWGASGSDFTLIEWSHYAGILTDSYATVLH